MGQRKTDNPSFGLNREMRIICESRKIDTSYIATSKSQFFRQKPTKKQLHSPDSDDSRFTHVHADALSQLDFSLRFLFFSSVGKKITVCAVRLQSGLMRAK